MKYLSIQGHECLSACLGGILGGHNELITPNAIVLLGNGFHISYDENTNIISTDMYNANFVFMKKYGVEFYTENAESKDKAMEVLKHASESGIPLVVKLNPEKLTYNRVFAQASNSVHYVCVLDCREGEVYICDNYVPTRIPTTFEGWVDSNMITEAWKDMYYEHGRVVEKGKTDEESEEQVLSIMRASLMDYLAGGVKDSAYLGKDAVLKLFENIVQNHASYSMAVLTDINFQLRVFGFISLKYIMFEQLQRMHYDFPEDFNTILSKWNSICMFLLKCGYSGKEEQYRILMDKVVECNDYELAFYRKLLQVL